MVSLIYKVEHLVSNKQREEQQDGSEGEER